MSISPYSDAWYSAFLASDNKDLDSAEKEKLYAWTENNVNALEQQYEEHKNNPEILVQLLSDIQEGFKKPMEWQANMLGEWIAANSWHGEGPSMEFEGAYAPLHHFLMLEEKIKTASSNAMEVEKEQAVIPHTSPCTETLPDVYAYDHSLTVLGNLDRCALFHIEKMKNKIHFHKSLTGDNTLFLIDEIQKRIFSFVRSKDLLALTCTDKCSRNLALKILKKRVNKGLISLDKELELPLSTQKTGLEEIANHFINLQYLSIAGMHPEIKDWKSKFTSVTALDLTDIYYQEAFNHTLKYFPSIEKLRCIARVLPFQYNGSTNKIKEFSVLKNCPSLKTIEFHGDFKSIKGLDSCNSLEEVIFNNCIELENIEALANLPNLTHLTIFKGGISEINFHLPKLKYLYIGSQYIFDDFGFLEGSPNLETLIVDDDCLDVDELDHAKSIHTLKLISFSNSIIPEIKKCVSLKTLILDTNLKGIPLDISELNQCVCLETLGLVNCTLKDISVLFAYPSLKSLYIQNCGNLPEAEINLLKTSHIKVFYNEAIKLPQNRL